MFRFSYYADTFIFCHTSFSWKQVITRGFPTYRAQAQLVYDPTSGKTFLFGGFTNSDYMKDKKHKNTCTFADLWELKIDVPGGNFDGVDWEDEKWSAKAGPWQRCFSCGCAGRWMKCGGASSQSKF
jgi:hypothetical protein